MKNLAVSKVNDTGYYKRGEVYETSDIYNGMIEIHSMNGLIVHAVDCDDFVFILNASEELEKYILKNSIIFLD